jgi:hypothetical protein
LDEAAKIVPKALMDAFYKALKERFVARMKLEDSMKNMASHPTVDNANALAIAGGQAAASETAENEAFDAVKAKLPFDLATRLDWARTETKNAMAAMNQAYDVFHAAEQAQKSLTPAPTLIVPGPPPLPPPPPPPPPN